MSVALTLAPRQTMTISPRLQQAIRLLQLSALEFETELQASLASNPFLEETEDTEAVDSGDPDGLPVLGPAFDRMRQPRSEDDDGTDLSWAPERRGLRDHLRSQLYAARQCPRTTLAAEVVIESLDDDGYLRDEPAASLTAIDADPPLSAADLDAALAVVQGFDPAGVGARDLKECLQLQLRAQDAGSTRELAQVLLENHLDALGRHDFDELRGRLGCSEEALRDAWTTIRRLDPHPGTRFSARGPDYVIPDVIVVRRKNGYAAVLNPAARPRARLNQSCVSMFRACSSRRHPQMASQLQEARWFLRNAEQRFDTILRVAGYIVDRQTDFFRYGDVALKPMGLREVADELGLHESTVSRATGNKFMQTPRGCLEFKHFFSRELPMRGGPACSAAAVRALIREIIAEEQPAKPLSDVDIARQLRAQGIGIARRTVSKYRRMMRLPPAELRREA